MLLSRSTSVFRQVHVGALALCIVFLPWSTAFLSMAQMLLAANWITEGIVTRTLKARFRKALTSAPALVFISFLLLHILGLMWTEDMSWGLDLGRILFPILVFGVILSGSDRLSANELRAILLLGACSAVACALFGVVFSGAGAGDYRAISVFISHIRLALLLCMAIAVFLHYRSSYWWINAIQWGGVSAASIGLARLGSLQGLVIVVLVGAAFLWRASKQFKRSLRLAVRTGLVVIPVATILLLFSMLEARHKPIPAGIADRAEYTAGGERYYHDTTNTQTENGTHIWTYIAWGELRRAWNLRSTRTLDDPDDKGHHLWSTAVRYLASKGVHKDSVSVMALRNTEVLAIEQGQTNVLQGTRGPIRSRIEEVLFELDLYRSKGLASGHSVTMRIEFQKAGWAIAKENWLIGVGTGDTQRAFDAHYETAHSVLEPKWRLRAHNEYLTLWISFGVFGLIWSLFTWWWPAYKNGAWRHPLFVAWAIAFGVSCFTDDTIETQAGATFFALYYALFVFAAPLTKAGASPVRDPQGSV